MLLTPFPPGILLLLSRNDEGCAWLLTVGRAAAEWICSAQGIFSPGTDVIAEILLGLQIPTPRPG